jgi:hypothetical protein
MGWLSPWDIFSKPNKGTIMRKSVRNILLLVLPVVAVSIVWVNQDWKYEGNKEKKQVNASFEDRSAPGKPAEETASATSHIHQAVEQTNERDIQAEVHAQTEAANKELEDKLANLEKELKELHTAMNEILQNASVEEIERLDPALQQQIADMSEQKERLANEYIESTFASEAVDPAWEAEANARISEGLAQLDSLASSSVQCATTMCRVNAFTTGEDDANAMSFLHSMDDQLSWDGQMRITVNHETGEMTAYLVRPGNSLPQVTN